MAFSTNGRPQDWIAALRRQWWHAQPLVDPTTPELTVWANDPRAGRIRGLDLRQVPSQWHEPLADAGVPLAWGGGVPWDLVRVTPIATTPVLIDGGRLELPPLNRFLGLTSLPLRDLRCWVAHHLGVRLQAETGIHCYLWEHRMVLINTTNSPRFGFCYGPDPQHRQILQLAPLQGVESTH